MTKAELVEMVYQNVAPTKKDSAEIVELVFELIKASLEQGEDVQISGFGKFVVKNKKSRTGRNPQTGQEMTISARRVLTFKPSNVLRKRVNEKN